MIDPARGGVPRSWRHFLYGLETLDVLGARDALRHASAACVPTMDAPSRDHWFRQQERAAGWG